MLCAPIVAACCGSGRSGRTSCPSSWRCRTRRCRASMRPSPASSTGAGRPATWSGCSPSGTTRRSAPATRSSAGTRRRTARSAPRSCRRTSAAAGIGIAVLDALEGWAGDHHATELEGPVSEDDEGSLAWAAHHGYTEVGRNSRLVLDLTAVEAPEPSPPEGIEIVTWAERPELAAGMYEVAREASPGHPGRGGGRHRHARGVARPRHAGRQRRSARGLRRARERRGGRLREAVVWRRTGRPRLPRPHRRQRAPTAAAGSRPRSSARRSPGRRRTATRRCRPRTRCGTSRSAA